MKYENNINHNKNWMIKNIAIKGVANIALVSRVSVNPSPHYESSDYREEFFKIQV